MEPKVTLYVTEYCGYCRSAKRLLETRGVPYREVDMTGDARQREEIRQRFGWQTVPVVVGNGELIGGFTELAALDRKQGLEHLK